MGSAPRCKAHDRQWVKDAVKPLRSCGVRVARRAAPPALGRINRRPGSPAAGLASRVCGLSFTLDFWLHACLAVFDVLKDVGGQYLFKERFSSLKAWTFLFLPHLYFQHGTLFRKSFWDI